jgi:hypothetical protein
MDRFYIFLINILFVIIYYMIIIGIKINKVLYYFIFMIKYLFIISK